MLLSYKILLFCINIVHIDRNLLAELKIVHKTAKKNNFEVVQLNYAMVSNIQLRISLFT